MADNVIDQNENEINRVDSISQELPGCYCSLVIDKYEIITSNIRNIEIREWVFDMLPRIQIVFRDDSLFFNLSTLNDKSKIKITIGTSEEDDKKKTYYFDVGNREFSKVNDVSTVTVTGYLNTKNLFKINSRAWSKMTSKDVIKEMAGTIGLKYKESDGLVSSDQMTWLQQISNFQFIKYIMSKASVLNDIPLIFADLNGNLNYKALKKELSNSQNIIKLEYKTDLFNKKTPDAVEKYKIENKKPDKYGHFYSFTIKSIQQYLDYFIGNGSEIMSIDYVSGKYIKTTVAGKTYPILTNNKDFKSNEGDFVDLEYHGLLQDSVHSKFFTAETENAYNMASFFSQGLCTNVNYLCEVDLLDVINLDLPSFVNNDATDINVPYSGNYVVGGIYLNFKLEKKSILPSKEVWMFRPGANNAIYK